MVSPVSSGSLSWKHAPDGADVNRLRIGRIGTRGVVEIAQPVSMWAPGARGRRRLPVLAGARVCRAPRCR